MPQFSVVKSSIGRSDAKLLAVGATSSGGKRAVAVPGAGSDIIGEAYGLDLVSELATLGFRGGVGETARLPLRDGPAGSLLVVGLGEHPTLRSLRTAGAAIADATTATGTVATTLAATEGLEPEAAARALVEGIGLGSYRFTTYKTDDDGHALESVTLHAIGNATQAKLKPGVKLGAALVDGVVLVRDLVNAAPADKRPPALADRVRTTMRGTGVKVKVLDESVLEKGGYGGLLGVGAGSTAPPRLVELTYAPEGAKKHVALVGKGITFDSGGLSLKTAEGMQTMKLDMAGAATALAAIRVAAQLGVKVRITALLALAENMPSGIATRPGDVLTIRGGRTVEVLNTDAEGRLVLADALVHASEKKPDLIVDLATLTGAVVTSLGPKIGAVISNEDGIADQLLAAADRAGERLWRLPLAHDVYGEELKGDIADIKNAGWSGAGTIRAALFLHEFVGDGIPWAHLDIAGTAWTDSDDGEFRKGATGTPLRTVVEWLRAV
ncbi:MAG TPA: leucyl aminopeptidase [Nitriliruptorales bacterium]